MTTTNSSTIKVQKRDGRQEPLDINKIHFVVEEACEGLPGVSASQIEMNANIQFYDGMTTKDIQKEISTDLRFKKDKIINKLDLVSRKEFEVLKKIVQKQDLVIKKLEKRKKTIKVKKS